MGGVGVTEFRPSDRRLSRFPRRGLVAALAARAVAGGLRVAVDAVVLLDCSAPAPRQPTPTPSACHAAAEFECPTVTVRSGASTLTSSADAAEATATSLRYQVGIGNTARECRGARRQHGLDQGRHSGPGDSRARRARPERSTCRSATPWCSRACRAEDDHDQARAHFSDGPAGRRQRAVLACRRRARIPDARQAGEIDAYVVYIGFDPVARPGNGPPQTGETGEAAAPPGEPASARTSRLRLGQLQAAQRHDRALERPHVGDHGAGAGAGAAGRRASDWCGCRR